MASINKRVNAMQKIKIVLVSLLMVFSISIFAAANGEGHRLVILVSTDAPRTQKIALNNAVNLQNLYGMDSITIEIVAYGPGLGMLTPTE
jgi:uncharacterized protein